MGTWRFRNLTKTRMKDNRVAYAKERRDALFARRICWLCLEPLESDKRACKECRRVTAIKRAAREGKRYLSERSLDFSTVDWSKNNTAIAREMHVCRRTVAAHRAKLTGGKSSARGGKPTVYNFDGVDWTRPARDIAQDMGCALATVHYRKRTYDSR